MYEKPGQFPILCEPIEIESFFWLASLGSNPFLFILINVSSYKLAICFITLIVIHNAII